MIELTDRGKVVLHYALLRASKETKDLELREEVAGLLQLTKAAKRIVME